MGFLKWYWEDGRLDGPCGRGRFVIPYSLFPAYYFRHGSFRQLRTVMKFSCTVAWMAPEVTVFSTSAP